MKIIDMHCDTVSRLLSDHETGSPNTLRCNDRMVDLNRMRQSGYLMQFFACFVNMSKFEDPMLRGMQQIDLFLREMDSNRDLISMVRSFNDICNNIREGRMSALLTIEEGGVFKGSIEALRLFYRLGVRLVTLTWNFENELGYPNNVRSEVKSAETEKGLKNKGIEFVHEMERLGMIIDVSHLSDAGFYDVYNNTTRPFAASHSNCRAVMPHVRNLTDDMIRKLGERGGIAGINYYGCFLSDDQPDDECISRVNDMVIHVKHMVKNGGIDVVALGTDFDGIDGKLEISDCSQMQYLYDSLRKNGFSCEAIDKIFFKNALRFLGEIL